MCCPWCAGPLTADGADWSCAVCGWIDGELAEPCGAGVAPRSAPATPEAAVLAAARRLARYEARMTELRVAGEDSGDWNLRTALNLWESAYRELLAAVARVPEPAPPARRARGG